MEIEREPRDAVNALQGDLHLVVEDQRLVGRDQAPLAAIEQFEAD